jgi:hypothetical protein
VIIAYILRRIFREMGTMHKPTLFRSHALRGNAYNSVHKINFYNESNSRMHYHVQRGNEVNIISLSPDPYSPKGLLPAKMPDIAFMDKVEKETKKFFKRLF